MKIKTLKVGQFEYRPDVGVVGENEIVVCGVCDARTDVKRNVERPRYQFIGGNDTVVADVLCDVFTCPYGKEKWHKQAKHLQQRIEQETSIKLRNILREEVQEILADRRETLSNIEELLISFKTANF